MRARSVMLLAIVAASSVGAARAADQPAQIHLVLREKNYHETVRAGTADEVGAIRVGMGELYDETATRRVGSMLMTCANTEVENGVLKSAYCSGVMQTDRGNIVWQTASTAEDRARKVHTLIVTGGSGDYAGMHGYGLNKFASQPSYQELFLTR